MADLARAYLRLLAPYLWQGEDLRTVVEVAAVPASARRNGVMAVTSQRTIVLMEVRPGSGLKTTLRTWSFRHRSLVDVTHEGPMVRLQTPDHALALAVGPAGDDPPEVVAAAVVATLKSLGAGEGRAAAD